MTGSTTAQRLQTAWDESSEESGFRDPPGSDNLMTRVRAERASRKFYELFFKKTGLHDSFVRGAFRDWNKLLHEEAMEIKARQGVGGFCSYLGELLDKKHIANGGGHVWTEEGLDSGSH